MYDIGLSKTSDVSIVGRVRAFIHEWRFKEKPMGFQGSANEYVASM